MYAPNNHISFDHDLLFDAPFRNFEELTQGEISLQAHTGVDVDNGFPVSVSNDFYQTFTATLYSNDPNVVFTSDGGRTTVPEPSGWMLLVPALAAALRARPCGRGVR